MRSIGITLVLLCVAGLVYEWLLLRDSARATGRGAVGAWLAPVWPMLYGAHGIWPWLRFWALLALGSASLAALYI